MLQLANGCMLIALFYSIVYYITACQAYVLLLHNLIQPSNLQFKKDAYIFIRHQAHICV